MFYYLINSAYRIHVNIRDLS